MKKEDLRIERVDELKKEIETLESEIETLYKERKEMADKEYYIWFKKNIHERHRRIDYCKELIGRIERYNVQVGDGVTICLYSDRNAGTVIKRTAKSITVQRDIATLDPNFKPEFVVGGFAGHCTNQNEQTYTYERDEEGSIETFRWSDKYGRYCGGGDQTIKIINGRHEFYDYNF